MKPKFQTHGLTHLALAVKDVKRSVEFYQKVFGASIMYLKDGWAQIQTPNSKDIIVFEENKKLAGKIDGGILHFGFRLVNASDIDKAVETIKAAGGQIKESGEFVPGEPYVFFYDPNGYEIEIWYEKLP
ncbi:MAG: VOC family protein [Bacteroidetes bacterium]|nr:VOC family protein [Bacteroidota bacterium]